MKILYLITKSEAGGAQTHVCQLSKYFIEKGNQVAIMSYPGGWLEQEAKKIGAKFLPNKYFSNSLNPFKFLKAAREIKKIVKKNKPDIIACHSTFAGLLGRLAIRKKVPTIFTAHGWAFTEGSPFLRKYLAIILEKIAGKFCSKIICVSNCDKKLAIKYKIVPKQKIVTIHNGVDIKHTKTKLYSDNQTREIKIIFVGRLVNPKNPLLLLESFNDLSTELKNKSQISIIGEGSKRKELEEFIKKNNFKNKIKLLGNLPRERVLKELQQSDIFVLISNWEGFPYTIIEAMNFGLPVIASNVGGINEAIKDDCGILVERGDGQAIKKALEKLLKDPLLIKEMGEKAKERVEKHFSLEKMLEETERVYKKVLQD